MRFRVRRKLDEFSSGYSCPDRDSADRSSRGIPGIKISRGGGVGVPIALAESVALATSIIRGMTSVVGAGINLATGEAFLAALQPSLQAMSGVGLLAAVSGDVLRVADAIDGGNAQDG